MATTLFEKQTITGFAANDSYYGLFEYGISPPPFDLIIGEKYEIFWDGNTYICEAQKLSGMGEGYIGVGNLSSVGGNGNDEPFIIGWAANGVSFVSADNAESHEIGIYEYVEAEDSKDAILAEQTLDGFSYSSGYGAYLYTNSAKNIDFGALEAGKIYKVVWDGKEYICNPAVNHIFGNDEAVVIGNDIAIGGAMSEEPFVILYFELIDIVQLLSLESSAAHTVAVYKVADEPEEPEEPEEPQGIILRNYHGENVVHEGIETISFGNTDGGTTTFTRGIALENVPISLDFANGDQTVTAEEETLIKSAVIEKPENLIPENIRIGQKIAGVDGAFIGEAEETEVDLNMANGDMVIVPSENKLFSSVTVKKPGTLIAANIADGINIGGIIGTHQGGGYEMEIVSKSGEYTATSTGAMTVTHNLGVLPDIITIQGKSIGTIYYMINMISICNELAGDIKSQFGQYCQNSTNAITMSASYDIYAPNDNPVGFICKTTPTTFQTGGDFFQHVVGKKYSWTVIGGLFKRNVLSIQLSLDGDGNLIISGGVPEIEQFNIYLDGVLTKTIDYVYSENDVVVDLSNDVVEYQEYEITIECVGDLSNYTHKLIGTVNGCVLGAKVWRVEDVSGAQYGFALSNGYYVSQNKGVNNSYALCKVVIVSGGCTATFSCINYAESNYDFGILSTLDNTLTMSSDADSANVYKSFKGSSMSTVQTVTYDIPSGEHFIYVKYRKDNSQHSNNDTFQFTVTLS